MAECVKTGCYLYLREYKMSVYGDLFKLSIGQYVLRCNQTAYAPLGPVIHGVVENIDEWWDRYSPISTLVVRNWEMLNLEGEELTKEED